MRPWSGPRPAALVFLDGFNHLDGNAEMFLGNVQRIHRRLRDPGSFEQGIDEPIDGFEEFVLGEIHGSEGIGVQG